MDIKNMVILDKDTEFTGEVTCEQLILEGTIRGDVHARNRVVLKKECIMEAKVVAGNFTMEQGANFRGELLVRSSDDIFGDDAEKTVEQRDSYESKMANITRLQAEEA